MTNLVFKCQDEKCICTFIHKSKNVFRNNYLLFYYVFEYLIINRQIVL